MVISEIATLAFYVVSIAFLPQYFGTLLLFCLFASESHLCSDLGFVVSTPFVWKVTVIIAISALPLYIVKLIRRRIAPAASSKLL